jgi:hypothetical protein
MDNINDIEVNNPEFVTKKQTAVELYEIEIDLLIEKYESKEISKREFITMKHNIFYQAKEMEKQQMFGYVEHSYITRTKDLEIHKYLFEQYYNETFKKI